MKKYSICMVIVVMLLLGLSSLVKAEESVNDFTLVNKTGYAISHVYVGPSKSDDWGENILGKDVLDDGANVDIKFHPKASASGTYDLKVTYKDDNSSVVWYGYDLTKLKSITIHYDREKDKTSAETEAAAESVNDFMLVNKTGYVIDKVFVGPSKSEDWGENVMGQDVLDDGASVNIKFHPKTSASGTYDLKVTYKIDNSSVVWYGYDLTKIAKITIHYDKEKDKTSAETE